MADISENLAWSLTDTSERAVRPASVKPLRELRRRARQLRDEISYSVVAYESCRENLLIGRLRTARVFTEQMVDGRGNTVVTAKRTFDRVSLPHLGNQVLRMGVAANMGLDSADIPYAAERGVNLWLYGRSFGKATVPLKALLAHEREKHVVVMLGTFVLTPRGARRTVEKARRELGIDCVDLFLMPWLGCTSRFSPAIQDELVEMREEGIVRGVGTSIHDRQRAGRLAANSILDAFMLRYNAKHPDAEQDVFPHLATRDPIVISYTATSWKQLLKPLKGIDMSPWPGADTGATMPPLTAALCYRFVLNSPHVHATWTGPANREQLDENLAALEAGPLSVEEEAWVREYGKQVKAKRKRDYV